MSIFRNQMRVKYVLSFTEWGATSQALGHLQKRSRFKGLECFTLLLGPYYSVILEEDIFWGTNSQL